MATTDARNMTVEVPPDAVGGTRGGTGDSLDHDRGVHPGDRLGSAHRLVLDCVADPLACGEAEDGVLLDPSTRSGYCIIM